jgi:hypothetical protein
LIINLQNFLLINYRALAFGKGDIFYICYMQLSTYISDLLYRYECVIVPGFGGFISNTISSRVNHFTHTFYPPAKKITFNGQLTNNDGLLANYVAAVENCSFEVANKNITAEVNSWKNQLEKSPLELSKIGNLSLSKEHKIVFNPFDEINYLRDAYGLDSYTVHPVKRETYKQKVVPVATIEKKKSSSFYKYAASVAALLAIGILGWKNNQEEQLKTLELQQQEVIVKKIQEATFFISNSLPEINLDLVKEMPKKYHLMAGSFRDKSNAYKLVKQLQNKGFKAEIVGVNKWGLNQVAFESYATREAAIKKLAELKKNVAKDAWLLIR